MHNRQYASSDGGHGECATGTDADHSSSSTQERETFTSFHFTFKPPLGEENPCTLVGLSLTHSKRTKQEMSHNKMTSALRHKQKRKDGGIRKHNNRMVTGCQRNYSLALSKYRTTVLTKTYLGPLHVTKDRNSCSQVLYNAVLYSASTIQGRRLGKFVPAFLAFFNANGMRLRATIGSTRTVRHEESAESQHVTLCLECGRGH